MRGVAGTGVLVDRVCSCCQAEFKARHDQVVKGLYRFCSAACKNYRGTETRRERYARYSRESNARLRAEMVKVFGGICECCGENNEAFLVLDHLTRRETKRGGREAYGKLRQMGWPKEGLRLLCCNCNSGRQWNGGVCPHLKTREFTTGKERYRLKLKQDTIRAYGSVCECCGEGVLGFLTLDHIKPVRLGQRRLKGTALYSRLRTSGWPQRDELRVLCFNCNCGREWNGGVCPHKEVLV